MGENIVEGASCEVCQGLADNNYTLHTFTLLLQPYGTTVLVDIGNVVSGSIMELAENHDIFDPAGVDESPRIAFVREAFEIQAECDEYSGANLAYFLNESISYYNVVNCQIDLTHSGQRQLFTGVTLLHTMPNETLLRLVFRRASITSMFEMPFGTSWSATPVTIRSLYDKKSPGSPYGYFQLEPCRETPSS